MRPNNPCSGASWAAPPRRIKRVLRLLVHTSARTSEVKSATLIATARALKNVPVTPVIVTKGRKTTMGVSVDPTSGTVNKGRLGDKLPSGEDYRPHEVEEMARRLWLAYCQRKKG